MYRVESLAVRGRLRTDEVFFPSALVCYAGDDPSPTADVVVTLDGEVIATRPVTIQPGKCERITPPGADTAPALTSARWLSVFDDGGIVSNRSGRFELAATVAGARAERTLTLAPTRGRVIVGDPIPGGCDG